MNNLILESKEILISLLNPIFETFYIVIISTLGAFLLAIIPSILLVITKKDGLNPNFFIFKIVGFIINTLRSFPFIILITVLIPLTRFLIGSSIGINAILIPMIIGAAPFVCRIIENSFNNVDKGVVDAAKSFGANNFQIIIYVLLKESISSLISGTTLSMIVILGYSAMAGVIGGGGIGDYAIRYGFQRNNNIILFYTVIILIILVQIIQSIGNYFYKKSLK